MYKIEVLVMGESRWCGNGLTFDTVAAAEAYATDLAWRWTAVVEWRVVPVEG